jgi:hypothetical protein
VCGTGCERWPSSPKSEQGGHKTDQRPDEGDQSGHELDVSFWHYESTAILSPLPQLFQSIYLIAPIMPKDTPPKAPTNVEDRIVAQCRAEYQAGLLYRKDRETAERIRTSDSNRSDTSRPRRLCPIGNSANRWSHEPMRSYRNFKNRYRQLTELAELLGAIR